MGSEGGFTKLGKHNFDTGLKITIKKVWAKADYQTLDIKKAISNTLILHIDLPPLIVQVD